MITRKKLEKNSSLDPALAREINQLRSIKRHLAYLVEPKKTKPKKFKVALTQPHWKRAMEDEMKALQEN